MEPSPSTGLNFSHNGSQGARIRKTPPTRRANIKNTARAEARKSLRLAHRFGRATGRRGWHGAAHAQIAQAAKRDDILKGQIHAIERQAHCAHQQAGPDQTRQTRADAGAQLHGVRQPRRGPLPPQPSCQPFSPAISRGTSNYRDNAAEKAAARSHFLRQGSLAAWQKFRAWRRMSHISSRELTRPPPFLFKSRRSVESTNASGSARFSTP